VNYLLSVVSPETLGKEADIGELSEQPADGIEEEDKEETFHETVGEDVDKGMNEVQLL
jgi:hypothetical protein